MVELSRMVNLILKNLENYDIWFALSQKLTFATNEKKEILVLLRTKQFVQCAIKVVIFWQYEFIL